MTDSILIKSIYCEKCKNSSYFALDLEIIRNETEDNELYNRVDIHEDHVLEINIDNNGDVRTSEIYELMHSEYEIEKIRDLNDIIADQKELFNRELSALFIEKSNNTNGFLSFDISQGEYRRLKIEEDYIMMEYDNIDILCIDKLDYLKQIDISNKYNILIIRGDFNIIKINDLFYRDTIKKNAVMLVRSNNVMLNTAKSKIAERFKNQYDLIECSIKKENDNLFEIIVELITILTPKNNIKTNQ